MESLSIGLSTSLPLQNHSKTHKSSPKSHRPKSNSKSSCNLTRFCSTNPRKIPHFSQTKAPNNHHSIPISNTHLSNLFQYLSNRKTHQEFPNFFLSFLSMGLSFPLSSFAYETTIPSEEISSKINLEAILVSIDDFFTKYPFFVPGVVFIWLIAIPLAEEYFQKYKFIWAIKAFQKLRDDPSSKLLDIRDKKSLAYLPSPSLRMLNKNVLQVDFREGEEDDFVKRVLENIRRPENTTVCVLDNFDGNSIKVAELLVKNGLKEAYAIRGGIRGKKGWQEIQETLLPPSVHINPKKKVKGLQQQESNGGLIQSNETNSQTPSASGMTQVEQISNGSIKKSIDPTSATKCGPRSLSPYPNYPDLKPPSSPTPSRPQS